VNGYLWLTDEDGTQVQLDGTSYQGDCEIQDLDSDGTTYETIMIDAATAVPESTSYERFECTFSTPVLADKTLDIYAIASFYGGDVWVDDVQLEQDEDATSYHAGYNTTSFTYDYVKLPYIEAFPDAENYYATLAHEITHWTRHPDRLDRSFGRKRFGDEGYAREELVAELGSAFLCADLELTLEVREDHSAYIASWLNVLKNDKRAIFSAAAHAQRAVDHLNGLQIATSAKEVA